MITRREFTGFLTGTALLASTGSATILLNACNPSSVFAEIEAWACPPAGGTTSPLQNAINGIVTILGPFLPPGATVLIAAITASVTAACGATQEYLNTTPPPVGIIAKIQTALTDIADNLQAFLNAFNIPGNPIIAVVIGLAQVILSTIAGFLGKLPVAAGAAKTMVIRASVRFSGVSAPVTPKVRTVKSFKSDYNAVCEAHGQTAIELQ